MPRCHLCPSPPANLDMCVWPVELWRRVRVMAIDACDRIRLKANGPVYRVESIDPFHRSSDPGVVWNTIVLRLENAGQHYPDYRTDRQAWDFVYVLRVAECGVFTCDVHRREVAPGRIHCADHWRAWEQVA